ncbi:MAG TPA: TrkH family potassium uptake protein [Pyrinomonadaceae bacterium]|nr:TrkH family potassium uptake protein [Pyrinomonadaceae bacterium]
MRLTLIAHTTGLILRLFGPLLLIPLLVDLYYRNWEECVGFGIAAVSASATGELLRRLHPGGVDLNRLEGLAVVSIVWLVVAGFGAIPYVWAGIGLVDSLFESMSGFTTTGATILRDFGAYSRGLFFWRSFTQWLGGMGVIALFIAVLPALAVAGRQLFFAEAPGPSEERLTPRIRNTAVALWSIYAGLTAIEILLLTAVGMPFFDSVCNSMSTLAAGGFSPHPGSIGGYGIPAAEWIVTVFMFLAGVNFALMYAVVRWQPGSLFRDPEFRTYAAIVLAASIMIGGVLISFSLTPSPSYLNATTSAQVLDQAEAATVVRHGIFQVVSILTTTGFATDDFNLWGDQAKTILFILMFIGGSAGSAAGGPKVVRILLIARYAWLELFKAAHPRAVKPVRLGHRIVPPDVMRAITAFLLLYLMTFGLSTLIVVLLGLDMISGLTASIATLGNIGPGYGTVGPMANFAELHPVSKLVLFGNMWIGRLEVLTVFVLLQPHVWKSARWRADKRSDLSDRK